MKRTKDTIDKPLAKKVKSGDDAIRWLSAVLVSTSDSTILSMDSNFRSALRELLAILGPIFPAYSSKELKECIIEIAEVMLSGDETSLIESSYRDISEVLLTVDVRKQVEQNISILVGCRPVAVVENGDDREVALAVTLDEDEAVDYSDIDIATVNSSATSMSLEARTREVLKQYFPPQAISQLLPEIMELLANGLRHSAEWN